MTKCSIESEKGLKFDIFIKGNLLELVRHMILKMQPEIPFDSIEWSYFIQSLHYHDVKHPFKNETVHR
jgi:hypothetical protein